ncbi:MAG: cyclic pyranopterin monophosphate synthase MoaC [bacterium]
MEISPHFDEQGNSRMVDVSDKPLTKRIAIAKGSVSMKPETFELIINNKAAKGNVLEVARIAGIMATKQTANLIPMCHSLAITGVEITFANNQQTSLIEIEARVKTIGQTGVEMEALTAVSVTALTIYDMCKAYDKGMTINNIHLIEKSGGKSGRFINPY